jgi:hypothetical protein
MNTLAFGVIALTAESDFSLMALRQELISLLVLQLVRRRYQKGGGLVG